MKNQILTISAVAIAILSFSSCVRSYTCTCQSVWDQQWYDREVEATSKRGAKKVCASFIAPERDGPSSCKLK